MAKRPPKTSYESGSSISLNVISDYFMVTCDYLIIVNPLVRMDEEAKYFSGYLCI